jgi:hypothetical protein
MGQVISADIGWLAFLGSVAARDAKSLWRSLNLQSLDAAANNSRVRRTFKTIPLEQLP